MATVVFTRNLVPFFPALRDRLSREVEGATVAEVLLALEAELPGLGHYLCDERGRLRHHVNAFVDGEMATDRAALGDPVAPGATIHFIQALSGG